MSSFQRALIGVLSTVFVVLAAAFAYTLPAAGADGPVPPTSCSIERTADGRAVTVDFRPVDGDGAFRYVIERRRDNSSWHWAGRVEAPGATFRNAGLDPNATYAYRVRSRARPATNSSPTSCGSWEGLSNTGGRAPLEPSGSGVLMGATVDMGGSTSDSARRQAIRVFQNEVAGRELDIAQMFAPAQDQAWKVDRANWMLANDQIPMITWRPGPRTGAVSGNGEGRKILAGVYDSDIRARAAQAKRINGPFFSRLFHEMDGDVGKPYDFTPAEFVRIWRHVRAIFAAEGVTNAVWVWTPASFQAGEAAFYPGDAHVDWIGIDPYSWIGNSQGSGQCRTDVSDYESMDAAIGSPFWRFAADHADKPIMLGEWGAGHKNGTDVRARFIRSVGDMLQARPQVKAVVYFSVDADQHCDWRLDQGPAAGRNAFRDLVTDGRWAVDTGALIRSS